MIVESPGDQQKYFRTGTSVDRAKFALCVTTWVILVWGSEWMDYLSSSCVRHVQFPNGDIIATFHQQPSHLQDNSSQYQLKNRPYLQLGLFLAELALAEPISIEFDSRMQVRAFRIHRPDATTFQSTDRRTFLKHVYRAPSLQYRNAVQYCLTCDDDRSSQSQTPQLSADIVLQSMKRIVEPLRIYYKVLIRHSRTNESIYASASAKTQDLLVKKTAPE